MYHSVVFCYWHKTVIYMQIFMYSFIYSFSKHLLKGEQCRHLLSIRHAYQDPRPRVTPQSPEWGEERSLHRCPTVVTGKEEQDSTDEKSQVFRRRWHLGQTLKETKRERGKPSWCDNRMRQGQRCGPQSLAQSGHRTPLQESLRVKRLEWEVGCPEKQRGVRLRGWGVSTLNGSNQWLCDHLHPAGMQRIP